MNLIQAFKISDKPKKSGYKIVKEEKLNSIPNDYTTKFDDFLGEGNYISLKDKLMYDIDRSWYTCDCGIRKQPLFDMAFTDDMTKGVIMLVCYYCYRVTFLYLEK